MNPSTSSQPTSAYDRWQRFSSAMLRGFHAYANWLVGISWKRFALLALALIIGANILQDLPPFTWRITQQVEVPNRPERPERPEQPAAAKTPATP
ncbi:sensor histidine kinase, partial [Roseateles sp. GG27B]